jgi:hypothetical protein
MVVRNAHLRQLGEDTNFNPQAVLFWQSLRVFLWKIIDISGADFRNGGQ